MAKASALLTPVRRTSMHPQELLSVRQAWSKMDHSSSQGHLSAGPTLDLVTALRLAHDEAQAPVLWPTPQEDWRSSADQRRGAATAEIGRTTAVGVVATGVAAAMAEVAVVVTVGW